MQTEGPGAQADSLSEAFRAVAHELRMRSRETLAPWDIAPSHFRAMGVLTAHGLMRLSELSDHLRIAPRSTTEVVDALEDRGLVQRKPDPTDRRATLVELTPAGKQMSESIRDARTADGERFFKDLTPADRESLRRILRKLVPEPEAD